MFEDLYQTPFPKMVKVKQCFSNQQIEDLNSRIESELAKSEINSRIKSGQRIAILAGSRGVARINEVIGKIVQEVKVRGAEPFIVPAMGSHGGATASGQIEVLASLGITEETMGCKILSNMEPVQVGSFPSGEPIYFDQNAFGADGIIAVNRVKPHTAFRGEYESGVIKILTIGAGKQKGASTLHSMGPDRFGTILLEAFKVVVSKVPVIFGVGIVENSYEQIAHLEAIPTEQIEHREPELLKKAWSFMPRLLIDDFDVLIIDQIGKNISGDGADPNITGRYAVDYIKSNGPNYQRLAILGLTSETHGNAVGIGMADVTTRNVFSQLDYQQMYMNAYTSKIVLNFVKVPMIMETDRDAIGVCLRTCVRVQPGQERVVRIKTTLHLSEIEISENLVPIALEKGIEVFGKPEPMKFDSEGRLID